MVLSLTLPVSAEVRGCSLGSHNETERANRIEWFLDQFLHNACYHTLCSPFRNQ